VLPNNWKLYMDNVKDAYHARPAAPVLHPPRINRLTQKGGVFVSRDGAHAAPTPRWSRTAATPTRKDGMRSQVDEFRLEDRVLDQVDEFGDRVAIQIVALSGFCIRSTTRSLARQVIAEGSTGQTTGRCSASPTTTKR
jgi:hypothetical protein